jgi:hypothetical protein
MPDAYMAYMIENGIQLLYDIHSIKYSILGGFFKLNIRCCRRGFVLLKLYISVKCAAK